MTKVKLKDATKELVAEAGKVTNEAVRVRKNAESLLQSLRELEKGFQRAADEQKAEQKRQEQQKAQLNFSRAYTSESGFVQEETPAVSEQPKAEQPKAEQPKAEQAKAEQPKAEQPKAEQAKAEQPKAEQPKTEQPKAAAVVAAAVEPKAEQPKNDESKAEAKPAAVAAQPKAQPAQDNQQRRPDNRGDRHQQPAQQANRPQQPKRPAIGQIMSRPGDAPAQPAKPVGLAPNVVRAPQPGDRPVRPAGPYGRPVNPQGAAQGQARPGQFGRPVGQPGQFGRPAGQPGQFGRPVGQPGQFGRPVGQPGQFGRPVNGAPGQRPMGGPRPAGAPGQRPMGGPRPQGGMAGRPGERRAPRAPELTPPMEKERVSNYDPNKKNYVRQHDPEHVARNRKQEARNNINMGMDDDVIRGGRRSRVKKPSVQQTMAPIKIENATMSGDTIIVRDLTEKIGKSASEIIKKLFLLGNMATINSEIDFDTASLVASEFGVTLEKKEEQTAEVALAAEQEEQDADENLVERPPVVTIMGHVDHGKTSLLDYIRKTKVASGEAGGITQHIGAYTVDLNGRKITFLDTPGHEAFTAMRARGTQATDIAVLVVAADDSVMPQTVESINHVKAAGVPMIVAINKMDRPGANPEKVKQDLTKYDVVCTDWGGEVECVPVSAATGFGIDDLLETILLQADVMELKANPNRLGRGVIIEAQLDKSRGPLATVLLQNGTLHVGDNIIAGLASGRVRALINDRGEKVKSAGPGTAVEIMGFDDVPESGDEMIAVGDDRLSRELADERREKLRASRQATAKMSMETLFSNIEEGKTLTMNLIIKADVQGSVEAVKQAMLKLATDEVKVKVLHAAPGAITKDDVNLASAFNAIIIGFNIRPDASAREAAEKEKVDIRLYTIIYNAIEEMELALKGMLAPEYKEVILGHAEVRNVFKITGAGIIAGCYVTDGKVQRNASVRLLRDNVVVHEGKLSSLRHLKDDVKEMKEGFECGMSLEGHNDIKIGDIVECFVMEEIPRT